MSLFPGFVNSPIGATFRSILNRFLSAAILRPPNKWYPSGPSIYSISSRLFEAEMDPVSCFPCRSV